MTEKVCSVCETRKSLSDFYGEVRHKDGKRSSCKDCDRSRRRKKYTPVERAKMRNRKSDREYAQSYRQRHRTKDLMRHAKNRAARRNLPFDLDTNFTELDRRVSVGICEISGVRLQMGVGEGTSPFSPSLDKICPEKGYTISNVRVVCYALNTAMGTWGLDPVLKIAKGILRKK